MKKIIATLLLMAAWTVSLPAAAQLKFGIVGGLNLTKLSTKGNNFSSDNRAGWYIGPKVEFTLPIVNLSVDAALEYSQRQMNIGNDEINANRNRNYKSIEIPLNVRYTLGLGQMLGVYIATGPQFGFNVGNKNFVGLLTPNGSESISMENAQVSWNIGVGVTVLSHLQVGAGYNFMLNKTGKRYIVDPNDNEIVDSHALRTNSWQVQAAYLF